MADASVPVAGRGTARRKLPSAGVATDRGRSGAGLPSRSASVSQRLRECGRRGRRPRLRPEDGRSGRCYDARPDPADAADVLASPRGFEPRLPPWKGDVL